MDDDDNSMRMLVDMIFDKKVLNSEELKALKPSDPVCLLTEDFIRSFKHVLSIKKYIVLTRWQKFFDTCFEKMLSSHLTYLIFVMFACKKEQECNQNIFETYISVCALVKLLCDETLQKARVNFFDLIPDIVTAFYRCKLKATFLKHRGFRRLVEYVRDHRYLKWKLTLDDSVFAYDSTAAVDVAQRDLDEKIKKELKRDRVFPAEIDPDEATMDVIHKIMANTVLTITLTKLPTLPSKHDLLKHVIAYKLQLKEKNFAENRKTDDVEKTESINLPFMHECSDSTIDCGVKDQDDIGWYENIIETVTHHNHSKSASIESTNDPIQKGSVILERHMKNTIKSLIETLDKFDDE